MLTYNIQKWKDNSLKLMKNHGNLREEAALSRRPYWAEKQRGPKLMWWLGLMTVVEWCMQRGESRWCFVKCNCKINEICECCSVRKPLLKLHLQQKHFSKWSQFVKGDIQKNKYYFKTRRGKARSKKSILTIKSVAASHERKGFGQVFTRFRNRSLSSPHSSLQSYMGFFRQGN